MLQELRNLCGAIQTAIDDIETYQERNGGCEILPLPDNDFSVPAAIQEHRQELLDASRKLLDLAAGPLDRLRWLCTQHHDSACIHWLVHHRVALAVPLDDGITYDLLATKLQVDLSLLRRILRFAMTKGLFCEPSLDFVKHTVDSAAMATWLSGWAAYNMEETFPASAKLVQATSEHSSQSERNQPAWNLAHGTSLPILEVLAANPERRNRFAETMVVAGKMHDLDVAHVHMFPWHELGEEAVVVDVGGSHGHVSIEIARHHPKLEFIVQDIALDEKTPQTVPLQVREHVKFMEHDFLTEQPVKHAAVYFLRFILHDHPESRAVTILQRLVQAMSPQSRIIVMDIILPEPNSVPWHQERAIRVIDMEMLTSFGSGERNQDEWVALFKRTDERLQLTRTWRKDDSLLSMMELTLV